jgi:hypothetical protein
MSQTAAILRRKGMQISVADAKGQLTELVVFADERSIAPAVRA